MNDIQMEQKPDLRGTSCDEFINHLSRMLLSLKAGESVTVLADKDRVACMHMVLKNSPRYIYKSELKDNYAEITVKKMR